MKRNEAIKKAISQNTKLYRSQVKLNLNKISVNEATKTEH